MENEARPHNSTLAIGGVSSPLDSFVVTESSVLRTNFFAKTGFSLITRNNSTIKVVDQNNENAIIIAPNPFKSATTVTFNEIQINTTIKIFDILGKEIKMVNFSGKEYNIEKGIMKEGLYILQVENENKDIKKMKIVLQ
jgi:hypothetical protein